ncbi:hypothetical protein DV735_g606, partial [Chaetothyriales sp. CBS 134920]
MFVTTLFMLSTLLGPALCQTSKPPPNAMLNTFEQLDRVNKDLAAHYTLNTNDRPFTKANNRDQGICNAARKRSVLPPNHYERRQASPLFTSVAFFDWNTLATIDHVEVTNQNYTDREMINDTNNPSTLTVSSSTAVADAATSGWKISGKKQVAGLEISAEYSEQNMHTVTQTKTVTESITCNVGEHCRIQTFTFTAHVYGTCWNQTWIDDGADNDDGPGDAALCKDGWSSGCGPIREKYDQICTAGRTTAQPDVPCVISVPVYDGGSEGNLLTLVVGSSRPA